jgi:tetratricopeptide (TPR) repeat protein
VSDAFLSYTHHDGDSELADALYAAVEDAGVSVFRDVREIREFDPLSRDIAAALADARILVALYSPTYPLRRGCQWELTSAYIAAEQAGWDPTERVLVVTVADGGTRRAVDVHPSTLAERLFGVLDTADLPGSAEEIALALRAHLDSPDLERPLGEGWAGLAIPRMSPRQWRGSPRFVGRLAEMWRLHGALLPEGRVALGGSPAPGVAHQTGFGGVGKSLLAEEYALRFAGAYPGGLYWIPLAGGGRSATDATVLEEVRGAHTDAIRRIAIDIGLAVQGLEPPEIHARVATSIAGAGDRALVVLDDLPAGMPRDELDRLFLNRPQIRHLITTRDRTYADGGPLGTRIDLGVLDPGDSLSLLCSHGGIAGNNPHATAIAQALGHYALAVDVAGAYLATPWTTPDAFLEQLTTPTPGQDVFDLAKDLVDELPNGHERSIASTLAASIDALGAEGRAVLEVASVLAAAPVPAYLAAAILTRTGLEQTTPAKGFAQVLRHSLAEQTSAGLNVHRVIARTVAAGAAPRLDDLRDAAIAELSEHLVEAREARVREDWDRLEAVMPHARALSVGCTTVSEAALAALIAVVDFNRGDYESARTLQEQVYETRQRLLGPEHRETLISAIRLTETLNALGRLEAALNLHRRVYETSQRVLGPEDPDALTGESHLAETLYRLGDAEAARPLHQHVGYARERLLGTEHPDTLRSASNLVKVLLALGKPEAARALSDDVFVSRQAMLGFGHPDTLESMTDTANILFAEGDLETAHNVHALVYQWSRDSLGPDHPHTVAGARNLAETLLALGDPESARPFLELVYETTRRTLGTDHPETLVSALNLVTTLLVLGDPQSARAPQELVYEHRRRSLGPEHPDTLTSASNLAETLYELEDLQTARKLQERVLEARQRQLGDDHPDTVASAWSLGRTVYDLGDLQATRILKEHVLEAKERLLGPEHPETLWSMVELALVCAQLSDESATQRFAGEALHRIDRQPSLRATLPPDVPDILEKLRG